MNAIASFFKQKTAYEIQIRDWSSDVCSSDLNAVALYFVLPLGNVVPKALHRPLDFHAECD